MKINYLNNSKYSNDTAIIRRYNSRTTNTVSFEAMKKSQFEGIDRFVVEKFKAPIEKFNIVDDLQAWAKNGIEKIKAMDFTGRFELVTTQRKYMIAEWADYVTKGNTAYTPTIGLLILSSIISKLGKKDDNVPPTLNKGVLAETVSETKDILSSDPKTSLNFLKVYQKNLRSYYMEDIKTNETETKWVKILSKVHDPENFESNVEKLKALSHKGWCTKSFNAEPYLSDGDFHIYLVKGQPKLGLRFNCDTLVEIQGEKNDSNVPIAYIDELQGYIKAEDMKYEESILYSLEEAVSAKNQFMRAKEFLRDYLSIASKEDVENIYKFFERKTERRPSDDGLIVDRFCQPREYYTFAELGIDEDKLFQYISEIKGSADFGGSKVISLGVLEKIGAMAYFENSQVKDLGNLKEVGWCTWIGGSLLTKEDFENVQTPEINDD